MVPYMPSNCIDATEDLGGDGRVRERVRAGILFSLGG